MVMKWVAITNISIFGQKIKNINDRTVLFSVFQLMLG